jgi:aspartyl-tRNA(Asn)/glutamyl-tRNA(Gln) amidotransferase subunit C
MSLSRDAVVKIAHLARLEMADADLTAMVTSLGQIVAFIDQLAPAPVAEIEPMAHPLVGVTQRLRPDVVTERDQRDKLQASAPMVTAGLYTVPRVME